MTYSTGQKYLVPCVSREYEKEPLEILPDGKAKKENQLFCCISSAFKVTNLLQRIPYMLLEKIE